MNRTIKLIITGAIVLIIYFVGHFIYFSIKYGHFQTFEVSKFYLWIFKDSAKKDIIKYPWGGFIGFNDVYNNYHYKRFYNIIVWEFKNLDAIKLKDISINQNIDLDNVKFNSGEIFDKAFQTNVKGGYSFEYNMDLNLDKYCKIEKRFEAVNYKGFYGIASQMSLSNEKLEHQIKFTHTEQKKHTLFLFYKGHNHFFIIIIFKQKPFNPDSLIEILNLN